MSTTEGLESLSAWVGEEIQLKLDDIAPDELAFVIERVRPLKANESGILGTFHGYEIGEDGPEDFISKLFGGGTYRIRGRKSSGYVKGVRHFTIAGPPFPLAESKRLLNELRGVEEDEEEEDSEESAWAQASPFGYGMGPPGFRPSPYGMPMTPDQWMTPRFIPFMRHVKQDDPAGVAAAITAMSQVLSTVMPQQNQPDPSHLIATTMQATQAQMNPILAILVEEMKAARKEQSKVPASEQMQLESFRAMTTMQTEAMRQMFTMQGQMMATQAETQAKMMTQGMTLLGKIITDAKTSEPDSLLEKLPGYIEKLMTPFSPPAGVAPMAPAAAAPAAVQVPAPAAPQQLPAGAAPADASQEELRAFTLHQARQILAALKFYIRAQPDPNEAWEQSIDPAIRVQQGKVRKAIEELPDYARGEQFAQILHELAGVPVEELQEVAELARTTEGGEAWLFDFWECAPWVPADDEEDEEVDAPPFTKPAEEGTTESHDGPEPT